MDELWTYGLQATLYKMASEIIKKNPSVGSVSYKLPNKHYLRTSGCATTRAEFTEKVPPIAVDLSFMQLANTKPEDAEVFCPVAAPR